MQDALGIHDPLLFVATVAVLNATPGVDTVLAVGRTLQHGTRAGLLASAGIVAGCGVHVLAAGFGLAALLGASAAAFTAVKWAGAAYLAWLAVGMLRAAAVPGAPVTADSAPPPAPRPSAGLLFRQGLLGNVLNPKVGLFFLALLPQFIDADAPHKTLAFLVLGGWMALQSALWLVLLVLLAARLRRRRARPAARRVLQAGGGLIFLGLALRLALAERP